MNSILGILDVTSNMNPSQLINVAWPFVCNISLKPCCFSTFLQLLLFMFASCSSEFLDSSSSTERGGPMVSYIWSILELIARQFALQHFELKARAWINCLGAFRDPESRWSVQSHSFARSHLGTKLPHRSAISHRRHLLTWSKFWKILEERMKLPSLGEVVARIPKKNRDPV